MRRYAITVGISLGIGVALALISMWLFPEWDGLLFEEW